MRIPPLSTPPPSPVPHPLCLPDGGVAETRKASSFEGASQCGQVSEAQPLAVLAIDELDPVCNHCFVQLPQSLDEKPLSVDWMVTILLNTPTSLASICLNSPLKPESLSQ